MRAARAGRLTLVVVGVVAIAAASCQDSNSGPGQNSSTSVPPPVATGSATTSTAVVTEEQAAYNVYRTFLDTSLAIGTDLSRRPDDGSLDPFTTPAYRMQIIMNLQDLKRDGITQRGQLVTRLLSSRIEGTKVILKVCSRDDVDQFDRAAKQLTPPGPGTPQIRDVGLLKEGTTWLVDGSLGTGEPCDV